jgi:hypothetical protein
MVVAGFIVIGGLIARAQEPVVPATAAAPQDPNVKTMVDRLDLDKFKATIKGLTQFGDRRQGTDRNRAAIDWIEAQLKSYGCTNTERLTYTYPSAAASDPDAPARGAGAGGTGRGGRGRGETGPAGTPAGNDTRRGREGGSSQFGERASTNQTRRARRRSTRDCRR